MVPTVASAPMKSKATWGCAMPYDVRIDHDLRLVIATISGEVTEAEVLAYEIDSVWSRPELLGYSELVDLTRVEEIKFRIDRYFPIFADSSARKDPPGELAGCLLIVAADDFHFGLGRMYQAHRELHPRTQRKVGVFRTKDEALAWLAAERASSGTKPSTTDNESCPFPNSPLP